MEIKTEEMMPYSTYYVPKGDYSRSNSSLNYNFDEMDTSFNEMDKLTKSLSRIEDKEAALNNFHKTVSHISIISSQIIMLFFYINFGQTFSGTIHTKASRKGMTNSTWPLRNYRCTMT
jgi:uncharacterized ion transporter superfamily protein YfcC